MVKKNIIANYLGQGWAAVMGLVFIPLYIQYLGMEAYGLIGLFTVMEACVSLLDMGMSPTLNREMARYNAGAHSPQSIRDLLRSLEALCFSLAALIASGVWIASGWLAGDWLKADKLPSTVVAQALSVMAFVAALHFVEGIYRGSLFGLQRQVWFNVANALLATLRHGGAISILVWASPTVEAFFLWQALVSMLTIAAFSATVHRALPVPPLPPRFSRAALVSVRRFAGGMMGISLLALLLTQTDKVLLSRLLPLESFGYYMLAVSVVGVIERTVTPITHAIYPRMVDLATRDDKSALASIYHQGAQLVTVLTAPAAMLLGVFAEGVLFMWSGDAQLAKNAAPILSVLVLGSFLNGLMWMPGQLQLAHGWTSLSFKTHIVAVAVLIPAIFWAVPRYGAVGAAWIWVTLNTSYVLISIHLMHRRLMPNEKWRWYFADVLLPIGGALGITLLAQNFQPAGYQSRLQWFVFLLVTGYSAMTITSVLANRIRLRLQAIRVLPLLKAMP